MRFLNKIKINAFKHYLLIKNYHSLQRANWWIYESTIIIHSFSDPYTCDPNYNSHQLTVTRHSSSPRMILRSCKNKGGLERIPVDWKKWSKSQLFLAITEKSKANLIYHQFSDTKFHPEIKMPISAYYRKLVSLFQPQQQTPPKILKSTTILNTHSSHLF